MKLEDLRNKIGANMKMTNRLLQQEKELNQENGVPLALQLQDLTSGISFGENLVSSREEIGKENLSVSERTKKNTSLQ